MTRSCPRYNTRIASNGVLPIRCFSALQRAGTGATPTRLPVGAFGTLQSCWRTEIDSSMLPGPLPSVSFRQLLAVNTERRGRIGVEPRRADFLSAVAALAVAAVH